MFGRIEIILVQPGLQHLKVWSLVTFNITINSTQMYACTLWLLSVKDLGRYLRGFTQILSAWQTFGKTLKSMRLPMAFSHLVGHSSSTYTIFLLHGSIRKHSCNLVLHWIVSVQLHNVSILYMIEQGQEILSCSSTVQVTDVYFSSPPLWGPQLEMPGKKQGYDPWDPPWWVVDMKICLQLDALMAAAVSHPPSLLHVDQCKDLLQTSHTFLLYSLAPSHIFVASCNTTRAQDRVQYPMSQGTTLLEAWGRVQPLADDGTGTAGHSAWWLPWSSSTRRGWGTASHGGQDLTSCSNSDGRRCHPLSGECEKSGPQISRRGARSAKCSYHHWGTIRVRGISLQCRSSDCLWLLPPPNGRQEAPACGCMPPKKRRAVDRHAVDKPGEQTVDPSSWWVGVVSFGHPVGICPGPWDRPAAPLHSSTGRGRVLPGPSVPASPHTPPPTPSGVGYGALEGSVVAGGRPWSVQGRDGRPRRSADYGPRSGCSETAGELYSSGNFRIWLC